MPHKKQLKNVKCLVCQNNIQKCRGIMAVTCRPDCSRTYLRIYRYIKSKLVSKHIAENKKLKEKIKVMWDGN